MFFFIFASIKLSSAYLFKMPVVHIIRRRPLVPTHHPLLPLHSGLHPCERGKSSFIQFQVSPLNTKNLYIIPYLLTGFCPFLSNGLSVGLSVDLSVCILVVCVRTCVLACAFACVPVCVTAACTTLLDKLQDLMFS